EMTKWFNTNYHYIVPEFDADTEFKLTSTKLFEEIKAAQACGITPKPVLVGPLSYLYLGKETIAGFDRLQLLPRLLPVYQQILQEMASLGVTWVQIDEPILTLDLDHGWAESFLPAYQTLTTTGCQLMLATYFGSVTHHATILATLPVAGLHLDLCRAPEQLDHFSGSDFTDKVLSLGIIDGRNIWRAELS